MLKRKSYTLSYKRDIVKKLQSQDSNNISALSKETGIDRKTIRRWAEQKDLLDEFAKPRTTRQFLSQK